VQSPIFGGFYQSRSLNLADQLCWNLYPESVETKSGRQIGALYSSPGLTPWNTVGSGPILGMMVMNQPAGDVLYVVSGGGLYSVSLGGVVTALGPLPNVASSLPNAWWWSLVTPATAPQSIVLPYAPTNAVYTGRPVMINNGTQVGIFYGISAAYQDGFALMNQPGTPVLWQSNNLDLSMWNALNFGSATGDPDNIINVTQIRREIFCLKDRHTQFFINEGNAGFAFGVLDGVYTQIGTKSPYTVAKAGETLCWIGQNSQGETVACLANPYEPQRISTHAEERIWQMYGAPTIAQAYSYVHQLEGHVFYVTAFPGAPRDPPTDMTPVGTTWAYDLTESQALGVPMWTRRGTFVTANGTFRQHNSNCFAFFGGQPLVGDTSNGNIYVLDPNALTDNGAQRKWMRSWRARQQFSDDPVPFHYLRVDMQTGIGVPDGTNPQCVLDWSDDGGHTWGPQLIRPVGPAGATAQRVLFNRLGATKRNQGLDRIFRLQSTDQFPVAIIGAEVR
jgi:hypothetical protein